jgi:hypothetical protein
MVGFGEIMSQAERRRSRHQSRNAPARVDDCEMDLGFTTGVSFEFHGMISPLPVY